MKNLKRLFFILNFILAFIFSQTLYGENKNLVTGSKTGTAVGAVARKMCNIIFSVLKNKKPYTPNI